ncbi:MAG: hypothetical protein AAGF93_18930 [Cyanobacteria bacterium P01_H01_bin.105]
MRFIKSSPIVASATFSMVVEGVINQVQEENQQTIIRSGIPSMAS